MADDRTKVSLLPLSENLDDNDLLMVVEDDVSKKAEVGYLKTKFTEDLATVASSGSYNDLDDTPTIPAAQIQSDWNQTNTSAKDYIKNKPTIPDELADLTDDSTHRTVTDTEKNTWNAKQSALTFDDVPTDGSNNPVKSNGIYDALATKANTSDVPTALADLSDDSTHRVVTDTEKTTWNAKSDFSGSYNDLTDTPTIPSDADDISYDNTESGLTATNVQDAIDEVLTEGGKVQDVKVDGVSVVDTNKVAQIDLTGKADTDGTYDDMTVGSALAIKGKTVVNDNAPYVYRPSFAGDSAVDKLIGGTIAWNQLVQNGNFAYSSYWLSYGGSISINNNKLTFTVTSTERSIAIYQNMNVTANHVYFLRAFLTPSKNTSAAFYVGTYSSDIVITANQKNNVSCIMKPSSVTNKLYVYCNRGTTLAVNDTCIYEDINVVDLTQAFGSTIADYVYTLEQSTAGSGIAWLKSYGFLTEDYYAYDAGSLQSVNASAHVMKDSNSQVIGNYALDSSLTLRGIPKLSSNKMYYDGDSYQSDGTVTRKYGVVDLGTLTWLYSGTEGSEFFYAQNFNAKSKTGTEVLANAVCEKYVQVGYNAVNGNSGTFGTSSDGTYLKVCDKTYNSAASFKTAMSGVYLVYELATPTTETATGFTNPQVVDANGTEEYTDYGVQQQTRDVAIPVGHETMYTHEEEIELPLPASTNGTYTLKATRSASGVAYSWVADA